MKPEAINERKTEIQRIEKKRNDEIGEIISSTIFEIFTNKPFGKLKPNEEDEGIIKSKIKKYVLDNTEIQLIGFWGMDYRTEINNFEEKSVEFLCKMDNQVKQIYRPGIKFNWILADAHAKLNGFIELNNYSNDLKLENLEYIQKIHDMNYSSELLSNIWARNKLSRERIEQEFRQKEVDWWDNVPHKEIHEKNANKIGRNAQRYYIARKLELNFLNPNQYIFHTFSNVELNDLFSRGTLFFYSRKGLSNSPWFEVE